MQKMPWAQREASLKYGISFSYCFLLWVYSLDFQNYQVYYTWICKKSQYILADKLYGILSSLKNRCLFCYTKRTKQAPSFLEICILIKHPFALSCTVIVNADGARKRLFIVEIGIDEIANIAQKGRAVLKRTLLFFFYLLMIQSPHFAPLKKRYAE